MKRKKVGSDPSKIYSYDCSPPRESIAYFEDQMRLASVYRNKLVEIENLRRAAVRTITSALPDIASMQARIAELDIQIEDFRVQIKAEKQQHRNRKVSSILSAKLRELTVQKTAVRAELKIAKTTVYETEPVKTAIEAIDEEAYAKNRAARKSCGLFWGTYLLVEKAMEMARKTKGELSFQRYTGEGRLGCQFQKTKYDKLNARGEVMVNEKGKTISDEICGLPVKFIFGNDCRLQIKPISEDTYKLNRGYRRRHCRTSLRLRIGSTESKDPIWTGIGLSLHRPLPSDGIIKHAWILKRKAGRRFEYKVQFSVESKSFSVALGQGERQSQIAIDIGWRRKHDGSLRIAYWADSNGEKGELILPSRVERAIKKCEDLQQIRDKQFNEMKGILLSWVSDRNLSGDLGERLKFLPLWKSKGRLISLHHFWKENRISGDEIIFAALEAWVKKEHHLYDWEYGNKAKAIAFRTDFYWRWCKKITSKYSEVIVESFDLSKVARRPKAEESSTQQEDLARYYRTVASLSSLMTRMKSSAQAHGAGFFKVDPAYTTLMCHLCGFCDKWDAKPSIEHECGGCHVVWDQDENAAKNLLARHSASDEVKKKAA